MPARPTLRTLFIAAVLFALLGGAWVWSEQRALPEGAAGKPGGSGKEGGKGGSKRAQPVSVAQVKQTDIQVWLDALGTVTPRNLATVRPRVDGVLLKVSFREGQTVQAGDLLAEIDPRPYRIALAQAEGQLARDTALLDNARLDLVRYQGLLARDAIPKQQVDTQAALVRQYQGTLAADRSLVDHARLQLEWTRVTAPVAGRIGLRQVDPGNLVRASDAGGLVSIAQVQPIAVLFALPETHVAALNRRLQVGEKIAVQAWDRGQTRRLAEGRVLTTDNQIDTATGTLRVKAEFPNRDGSLFPNQFVNIRLLLETHSDVLAVPAAAVQRGERGSFVYRVADGRVAMVPVTPGAAEGEWLAVQGELKAGETVVSDGLDKLRDGAKVEVIVPGAKGGKGGRKKPE